MHEFASMTGRDFPVDGYISVSIAKKAHQFRRRATGAA